MKKFGLRRAVAAALLCFPLQMNLKAEDAPPVPPPVAAPAQETSVVTAAKISIASFDALKDAINGLFLPLPPQLDPQNVEQQFGFLGKDGLDRTRPAAVYFQIGAEKLPQGKAIMLAIPATHPENFLNQLKAKNVPPVVAGKEIYLLKESYFRFTPNYILFGGTLDAIQKVDEAALAASFTGVDAIARVEIDQKSIRQQFPEVLEALYANLKKRQAPQNSGQAASQDYAAAYMKKMDTMKLELSNQLGLGLKLWITPGYAAIPPALNAPGVPANCPGRLDFLVPSAGTGDWSKRLIEVAEENGAFKDSKEGYMTPFMKEFVYMLAGGDGLSAGITNKNGEPVVYVVKQYTVDYNFATEAKKTADKGAELVKAHPDADGKPASDPIKIETYQTEKGEPVTRVVVVDKGTVKGYFDALQRGKTVYMTFSPKDGKYLGDVTELPTANQLVPGLSAQVDVALFLETMAALPPEQLKEKLPMSPEDLKELAQVFKGKPLTLSYEVKEANHLVALKIPPNVIAGALKLMLMSQPLGDALPPGGAPPPPPPLEKGTAK